MYDVLKWGDINRHVGFLLYSVKRNSRKAPQYRSCYYGVNHFKGGTRIS